MVVISGQAKQSGQFALIRANAISIGWLERRFCDVMIYAGPTPAYSLLDLMRFQRPDLAVFVPGEQRTVGTNAQTRRGSIIGHQKLHGGAALGTDVGFRRHLPLRSRVAAVTFPGPFFGKL